MNNASDNILSHIELKNIKTAWRTNVRML